MMTDETLSRKVSQGDQEAFKVLFERHRAPMFRFCLLMLGDRAMAEDVYQEAFITLYRTCRRGETIFNVRAYLLTIARRRCINYLRDNSRYVPLDEPELVSEMDIDTFDLNDVLRKALLAIPAQYRETFLLFELEGYSYKEIAECLELTGDAVRNRIYRAKKALQKILDPMFDRGTTQL